MHALISKANAPMLDRFLRAGKSFGEAYFQVLRAGIHEHETALLFQALRDKGAAEPAVSQTERAESLNENQGKRTPLTNSNSTPAAGNPMPSPQVGAAIP